MNVEERLIQLFNELSNPESPNINAVTSEIQEFLQNPNSIFILFQICSNNTNDKIRHYCLVFMRRNLHPIFTDIEKIDGQNLTYLIPLKEMLLKMLIDEPVPQLKNAICDVIEYYATIIISISTWPELYQFAMNLLQDPNQLYLALYLMYCIYPVYAKNISDEEPNEFFIPYSTLTVNSLLSDIDAVRIQAIECLSDIIFEIIDDDDILVIPNFMEILKTASERAVFQYANENECAKLFGTLFETIFYDRFDQFNDFLPHFYEFTLNVVQNPQISTDIKIKCHQVLTEGPRVLPDFFSENLISYLSVTLELSIIICEIDREMPDYQFCHQFLFLLSSYANDADGFYELFIQYVNGLFQRNTPSSIQVALFALSCIVSSCSDSILEEPDLIIDITMKCIQSEDVFIMDASNELLLSLVENASTCLSSNLDNIVKIYANKLYDIQYLQTLSSLLAYVDHPPSDLKPFISILLEILFNPNHPLVNFKSEVIRCLSNSISHAEHDETLYQLIAPQLITLANQEPTLISDVFNCFGSLLVTSPTSIMNDVHNIMQIVFTSSANNEGCAKTLLAFIENLPISMRPFTDSTIQFCMTILNTDENEFISNADFMNDEDGVLDGQLARLGQSRGAALKMISYLMPGQMYVDNCVKMLHSVVMSEQFDSSTSIINCANSLFQMKIDPSPLLSALFVQLYEQSNAMIAAEMIDAINALVSAYPSRYITENSSTISSLIINVLNEKIECFSSDESKQSVEEKVMPSISLLFDHFTETIGTNFTQLIPLFQDLLFNLSRGQSRNLRGYATQMLTKVSIVVGSLDLIQLSLSSIAMNIKLKHLYLKINIFNALRIILRNVLAWKDNQQLAALVEQVQGAAHQGLMPILNSVVSGNVESKELFESAVALWSRCIVVFNWSDFNKKDVAAVLQKVDPLFENDNGKCIDSMELLMLLANDQEEWGLLASCAVKIAIRLFAQVEWDFVRTPKQILEFAKNVIMSNENVQAMILETVGFNERVQKQITDRLG